MLYRQYELTSGDTHRVGWLASKNRLKPGTRLTLVGDDEIWTVVYVTTSALTKDEMADVRGQTWAVGGIQGRLIR